MVEQLVAAAPPKRTLRVFISSTFRDMQAEREELIKYIFPGLRKLCESRGVIWGEVDLRWGITDEQRAEGNVLPICLAEIQNCRPYFIGLLGERYGWVPKEIPQELIDSEPWLEKHRTSSVTELEIIHGALDDPLMARYAFFYFRSPSFINSLNAEERPLFQELPTSEEVERLGQVEAERLAEDRRKKLESLKQRIRNSGLPVREDYPDPRTLGEMVLADLTEMIDELYPEGLEPHPLDHEAANHESFATSLVSIYMGGERSFACLDAHAEEEHRQSGKVSLLNTDGIVKEDGRVAGHGLVVAGEPGVGKSALLANWALHYRTKVTESKLPPRRSIWKRLADRLTRSPQSLPSPPLVLTHFIGATDASTDGAAMLRRIIGELNRQVGIEQEISEKPDELRVAFANCLHMAAAKRRVVLIIDALNQLEDRNQALDLIWLPEEIPLNVRLIVSTLSGPTLKELARREWPVLFVEPLTPEERQRLIIEYLAQYRKALSPDRVKRIAAVEQTGNPLFLRVLLQELRIHGDHLMLDRRIDHYLSARAINDLFEKILERYEQDYDRDRPGLVRDAMTILCAARHGLSEGELLELLGSNGERLPQAVWSPLHLAAEQSLVSRSGLIVFSHDYLRIAVRDRYLPTESDQASAHLRLADYFEAHELERRKLEELPWQLARAKAWQRLYELLADLQFVFRAWENDPLEVKTYWTHLEAEFQRRPVDAYQPVIQDPESYVITFGWGLHNLVKLLFDTGYKLEAELLGSFLVENYQRAVTPTDVAEEMARETLALIMKGQESGLQKTQTTSEDVRDQASKLTNRDLIEAMCRLMTAKIGLLDALQDQAVTLEALGDLEGAMALLKKQEGLCRDVGAEATLGMCFNNQATIQGSRGNLNDAMDLLKEAERIGRKHGDKILLHNSLGNQAIINLDRGSTEEAMVLLEEQKQICRQLGDRGGFLGCISNQAIILRDGGELDKAMLIFLEVEKKSRQWGDKDRVMKSLGNQGLVLFNRGELDEAMALFQEIERMARAMDDKVTLHTTLGNEAAILQDRSDHDGAFPLLKEKESISRELGDKRGLKAALEGLVKIHHSQGDLEVAMELAEESESINRELNNMDGVARALFVQGLIADDMSRLEEALHLIEEAHCLATNSNLFALAQQMEPVCNKLATKLRAGQQVVECREAVHLRPDDPEAHNDLAIALFQSGDIDAAIAELHEVLRLSPTHSGAHFGLGMAYERKGDLRAALEEYQLAYGLFPDPTIFQACERLAREIES